MDNKLSANWKWNWRKNNQTTLIFKLLSVFCRIVVLSWTSTLHRRKSFCIVKHSILKQNYRTCLKMKIASYVYCRNKLVSHKKSSQNGLTNKFLMHSSISLYIAENKSVWVFQSDRFIHPVPHTSAINVTEMTQFLLI